MTKNTVLKIINPILGVLVLNQALTGIFSDFLPRKAFEILHEGGGYLLVALSILHVILNWNWVKANLLPKRPAVQA